MTGSSKQTTTSNSAPWEGAQPALKTALSGAENLYKADIGNQPYTQSTVVPWSAQTQQATNAIQGNATANMNGQGLSGNYQSIIGNGGFSGQQLESIRNAGALADSSYSVPAELQAVLDQNGAKMGDAVNLSASGAGRYGSGSHQGVLAKSIGDMRNSAILSDYQNFQGRKDAANMNRFGMAQQGIGNLGTAYSGLNAPAQDMMSVGAMQEDLATREMNDKLRIFNEQQNLPWENVSRLNAIASGAGSLGGTTRQTQPGQNPFLTALGYGVSGAGLLGM